MLVFFSDACLFFCCFSRTIRPYDLLTGRTLVGGMLPTPYMLKVFHKLLIIFCLFIHCSFHFFFCVLFEITFFVIWTNTVRTEVAKTAKRANEIAFLIVCYFVVSFTAVGKYKERRHTDEIEPTKPTIITNTDTPVY